MSNTTVKAWYEDVVIPTYRTGKPEKNPIFLENRVYQGSSGVVYPYPVIESIEQERTDVSYKAVYLENEYIKVMILPELGGRVQMAYDKIRKRHFVYYNQVIKPALVGLAGPWISGGIEFNWPQHHRPSTFSPVDVTIEENADGSATVWVNEREKMFHLQGQAGFTLRPGHAFLEIRGKVYNPTEIPQTFLWWANPAVEVNDEYQSVFPPDVNAVFDHGKRAVSTFPIATGTYYKMDYSAGVDISNYRNIFVPTSYMVAHSDYDFEGGYENDTRAGMLHVADHHYAPGKKQWTWGNGDFGRAWDRNLTDPLQPGDLPAGVPPLDDSKKMNEYRPYIELMAGVYTENQPDFSWIMPYEEKTFVQYFMPYRELGMVKNASKDLIMSIEKDNELPNGAVVRILSTSRQSVDIRLWHSTSDFELEQHAVELSPEEVHEIRIENLRDCEHLNVTISRDGKIVLSYNRESEESDAPQEAPQAAEAALRPEEISTNEQLYLTGVHLEQYRHASWSAKDYYEEALRRDPNDYRCNNAMGLWYMRHCCMEEALPYLKKAVKVLQRRNLNPYDGEPIYNLGLCHKYMAMRRESSDEMQGPAYDCFCKSTWNSAWQAAGYLGCAQMSATKENWAQALEEVDKALISGWHNHKARALKAAIMGKLGMDVKPFAEESLAINPFNYGILYELGEYDRMKQLMRRCANNYDELALDYCAAGLVESAREIWKMAIEEKATTAMTPYYIHWTGDGSYVDKMAGESVDFCFPNRIEDAMILGDYLTDNPDDARAHYLLGNLYYDKRQYEKARMEWECSRDLNDRFPTVWRNLALAYANKFDNKNLALECMERAFNLDTTDARVFMELDQLRKNLGADYGLRYQAFEQHRDLVEQRDDLLLERATLLNQLGRFDEAKHEIDAHVFQPWEGGEGKVTAQYQSSRVGIARNLLSLAQATSDDLNEAVGLLDECLVLPRNLGEGKLYGAQDNDFYFLKALAFLRLASRNPADREQYRNKAIEMCIKGTEGPTEPVPALYYNDAKPDKIFYAGLCYRLLAFIQEDDKAKCKEMNDKANAVFFKLMKYGSMHYGDHVTMDYFAVSLPDLQVWDDSLDERNRRHCMNMYAFGRFGLGDQVGSSFLRIGCSDSDLPQLDLPSLGHIIEIAKEEWNKR